MPGKFTNISVLFAFTLLAGCASGPSGESFDSPIGVWNEKWESSSGMMKPATLTIIDESRGAYTPNGVEFHVKEEPRTWKGFWIMDTGSQACLEDKDGSPYWGETTFRFNETYNRYSGTWDMCGMGQKFSLAGRR